MFRIINNTSREIPDEVFIEIKNVVDMLETENATIEKVCLKALEYNIRVSEVEYDIDKLTIVLEDVKSKGSWN